MYVVTMDSLYASCENEISEHFQTDQRTGPDRVSAIEAPARKGCLKSGTFPGTAPVRMRLVGRLHRIHTATHSKKKGRAHPCAPEASFAAKSLSPKLT
jgi:hypothetical protein